MKPRIRLRLVAPEQRPLAKLSQAEKLAQAKLYLKERGISILHGAPAKWGIPYSVPAETALMKELMEADRRRK